MTCFSIQKFPVLCILLLTCLSLAAPASAQDRRYHADGTLMTEEEEMESRRVNAPIVVELFTASDCTACIVADKMLYDSMENKNVIALSCHIKDFKSNFVDGYRERAGDDAGSSNRKGPLDPCILRQWTYNSGGKITDENFSIPQFVINGSAIVAANSLTSLAGTINRFNYAPRNKTLGIMMRWQDRNTVSITMPGSKLNGSYSVWLLRYKEMAVEKMDKGVNKDKVLRFSNIIQSSTHLGKWRGKTRTMNVDVAPPQGGKERGGYVVVVQEIMGGDILAAGKLEDYPMPNDKQSATRKSD